MSDSWCKNCKEFMLWPNTHQCPPRWCVHYPDWHGDDLEEHSVYYAISAEKAGEKWAEQKDCEGDYTIVGGSPAEGVLIWREDEGPEKAKKYDIYGEAVPEYRAEEAK